MTDIEAEAQTAPVLLKVTPTTGEATSEEPSGDEVGVTHAADGMTMTVSAIGKETDAEALEAGQRVQLVDIPAGGT